MRTSDLAPGKPVESVRPKPHVEKRKEQVYYYPSLYSQTPEDDDNDEFNLC